MLDYNGESRCEFLIYSVLIIINLSSEFSIKEATKGYYSDFHALKKFGGKTWIAPPTLIREDVCFLIFIHKTRILT